MNKNKKYQCLYIILSIALMFFCTPSHTIAGNEAPDRVFEGRRASEAVLANLDYQDVKSSDTWAKEAIWETGALQLMKGYGAKRFGLSDMLTVEQALAVAYNMAGREAEAQLAAEALDIERSKPDRKIIVPAMWSDGYLQLAFNDELLTQEEYDNAFAQDQTVLGPADFRRGSPVTREDMAFYVAKVMMMNPVNTQTHLFNSYTDWQQANPHRIPYIEVLLQNRVMNGNNGSFSPKGPVTREQAAQILQNAEPFLFSRLNLEKLKGTIEQITQYQDKTNGMSTTITQINVRNSSGMLHQFHFTHPGEERGVNEINGDSIIEEISGTIVNDQDVLKNETALREGQEITYFIRSGRVEYVTILAGRRNTEYRLVKILSADETTKTIRSEILLELPFSDIRMLKLESLYSAETTGKVADLSVSTGASISVDFIQKGLKDIKPETLMLLTIENGLVTVMEKVNADLLLEQGIVSGILEENNPVLGYVTLYFPDGSGTSPEAAMNLAGYRTYSWLRPDDISVYKNGTAASLEDLQPGDSIFIKLDEAGNVVKISGADNFYPVYGTIRTKGNGTLQLDKQDGTVQMHIPENTPIFKDNKRISWNDLLVGDNIKILQQQTGNQMIIGEITVEKNRIETSGIYKAQLLNHDSLNKSLVVSGLQQFKSGIWLPAVERGITKLSLNDNYTPVIPKGAQGTVYIATGENLLGKDMVIRMALDDESLLTETVNDTILQAQPGLGRLALLNADMPVLFDDSTLVIKDGRLLEANQVKNQDEAILVTGSLPDGSRKANIVWLQERAADTGLMLLRGRISQIEALSTMTLQSFSEFRTPSWEFTSVPKTLTIDPAVTRILDDDGRTDPTEFDDFGAASYKNRTVYVLAQNGKAMLVSTAPYGDVIYTGRITKLSGAVRDSFGQLVTPPASLTIKEVAAFNPGTWNWESKNDTELMLPVNTVLYKNGVIIDAGLLEEGDTVTVIRGVSGNNAFVVMVQSY